MENFAIFSALQFVVIVAVMVMIANRDSIKAFENRIADAIRRRRHNRCEDYLAAEGMAVVPAPAMTKDEVIRILKEV